MNAWQVAQQIKHLLKAATWSDSPSDKCFGNVLISNGPTERAIGQLRFPFALVLPLESTADDSNPNLERQTFEIRVIARVANDAFGESVLIGGCRTSQGSSGGRGILELEEVLLDTVATLDRTSGINIRLDLRTAIEAQVHDEIGYVGSRGYRLSAFLTADKSYGPVNTLAAIDAGAGSIALSWVLPSARYDTIGTVLRRASGGTPPATITDGTNVAVADSATSYTDPTGFGDFSYSMWRSYTDTSGTTANAYSEKVTASATLLNLDFSVAGNSGHIVTIGL